jgi:hypothetical protein
LILHRKGAIRSEMARDRRAIGWIRKDSLRRVEDRGSADAVVHCREASKLRLALRGAGSAPKQNGRFRFRCPPAGLTSSIQQ